MTEQGIWKIIAKGKTAIKKYTDQQKNVRNNREFNSLSKQIEFQELEIQLAEKQIKEMKASIEHKKEVTSNLKEILGAEGVTLPA